MRKAELGTAAKRLIHLSLREDAVFRDVTTEALIPKRATGQAKVFFWEEGIVCGLPIVRAVYQAVSRQVRVHPFCKDGAFVKRGKVVCLISGPTHAILRGERVALNFLGRLSGVATLTHAFVRKVKPYPVEVLDTRKTMPGWRPLEKYAVRTGGGKNHRFNLADAVLIKTNHLRAHGGGFELIQPFIREAQRKKNCPVYVEVADEKSFLEALKVDPDVILLDNWSLPQIRKAVAIREDCFGKDKGPILEASGSVTLSNVRRLVQTGIRRISIGALTHSARSLDVSLRFERNT
ncbi:MAG: carboxylating nicotinate-nucleotide diphosphorylase [Candidatus Omnitrophota bacterium]